MLTPAQARTAVVREWTRTLDLLAALDEPGWATPTRCTGWTLTDLARHGAWGTSMEADAIRRARTADPGAALGREPAGGPDEVLAALRAAVDDLDAELGRTDELPDDAAFAIPFGAVPAAFGLQVFTMEAGVHADDAAHALGHDDPLPDDVVVATGAVLPPVLPVVAGTVAATPPPEGTVLALVGPTVDLRFAVTDGAWGPATPDTVATATLTGTDDTTVVRLALGRITADDPRLTITGDAGVARGFATWFPFP